MSQARELGRTRLYTRRERRRRLVAIGIALLGAVVCVWVGAAVVSWIGGQGWRFPQLRLRPFLSGGQGGGLLGLPRHGQPQPPETAQPQFPVTLTWPVSPVWSAVVGLPLWLGWYRFTVRPLLAGLRRDTRHRGLAAVRTIRASLGPGAARRAGRFTLKSAPWWRRLALPDVVFGFGLGYPHRPCDKRLRLRANWEQRIRLVARQGWGKTMRLLVPVIRDLPGPALVSSIEPGIFESTVTARQFRRPALRWWWLTLLGRRWLPVCEYPIAVVDFSAPEHRFAAGYPQVRWNPILGCSDFTVAHRRAAGLVTGAESEKPSDRGSDTDQFFRDAATEVLAAWLHAADLGGREIGVLQEWLEDPVDTTARSCLRDDPRADPSAAVNLSKHLDPKSGKTTSGVERYLVLAMNSVMTVDGRRLCGTRQNQQFDLEAFIRAGGTLYVLADTTRIGRCRPLLSLLTGEVFMAAEKVALARPDKKLPLPFVGVLDELRYGVTVPNLPYVSAGQRKYGITFVYAVQSSAQEEAVYGSEAKVLRDGALSVIGGIDIDSAREIQDRAGQTPVVVATRGDRTHHSEHVQLHDALTIADQQELADGQAVIITRGMKPFLATMPSIYDHRPTRRRVEKEATAVAASTLAARHREHATTHSQTAATSAGADFTHGGNS